MQQVADTGYFFIGNTSYNLSIPWNLYIIKANATGISYYTKDTTISVSNLSWVMDTASFNVATLNSVSNANFVLTTMSSTDSTLCYNLGTSSTSVQEQQPSGFSVSPNPTNGMVTFRAANRILSVEALDITGRVVCKRAGNTG